MSELRTIEPRSDAVGATSKPRRTDAFTMVELLVVIALTLVMMTLLFGPLVQGFRLTNQAQTETAAQNAARIAMEQISREIGSAAIVRDTTHKYLNIFVYTKPSGGPAEVVARAYGSYLDIEPARVQETASTGQVADPTVDPNDYIYHLNPTSTWTSSDNTTATTNRIALNVEVSNSVQLPVAPAPTLVRYFVGLRHPINFLFTPDSGTPAIPQPYNNLDERQTLSSAQAGAFETTFGNGGGTPEVISHNLDNSYILYRAEVPVYATVADPATDEHFKYFDEDANGNPILDDPDFFRFVSPGQINPVQTLATGATVDYTTDTAAAHNNRVYRWYQIARPVIDVGNVNLLFQPHDGAGNVVYDPATGYIPGTSTETDPITGVTYPLARTSVTFEPTSVSNDSLSPTASSDVPQGYGSDPADTVASYIPTMYQASNGQWDGGPNIVLTSQGGPNLTTYIYNGAPKTGYNTGDLIETQPPAPGGGGGGDVYNVTQNIYIGTLPSVSPFVAMTVDSAAGTVNFSLPDLPLTYTDSAGKQALAGAPDPFPSITSQTNTLVGDADSTNLNNPYWFVTFGSDYGATGGGVQQDGSTTTSDAPPIPLEIHLKTPPLVDPMLASYGSATSYSPSDDQVLIPNPALSSSSNLMPNIDSLPALGSPTSGLESPGKVVVNSERIYGPEQDSGPGGALPAAAINTVMQMPLVLYHRIPYNAGGIATIGPDQYMIDYDDGIVYLGQVGTDATPGNINVQDPLPQHRTVIVAYNWQNNDIANINNGAITSATGRVSYQTGTQINVSIGVRLYDPETDAPTYFNLSNAVTVGNAIR